MVSGYLFLTLFKPGILLELHVPCNLQETGTSIAILLKENCCFIPSCSLPLFWGIFELIGSLSNDGEDSNENGKKAIGLQLLTT